MECVKVQLLVGRGWFGGHGTSLVLKLVGLTFGRPHCNYVASLQRQDKVIIQFDCVFMKHYLLAYLPAFCADNLSSQSLWTDFFESM